MVSIVSGMIAQSCANNPITKLWDELWMRIRVAEFIQLLQQSFISRDFSLIPRISFGAPLTIDELIGMGATPNVMDEIIDRARQLLTTHVEHNPFFLNGKELGHS